MTITSVNSSEKHATIYTIEIPDEELEKIKLDELDQTFLKVLTESEKPSDVLAGLGMIAGKIEDLPKTKKGKK